MPSFAQHLTVSWHAIWLGGLEFNGILVMSTILRVITFKLRFFLLKRKIRRALSGDVPAAWMNRAQSLLSSDSDSIRNLAKAPSQAIKSFWTTPGK
jgi:hypothetical protein